MGEVGGLEDGGPAATDRLGGAEVDRGGGVEADAAVAVLEVVVAVEAGAEGARVLERAEALGERRTVLEGLEGGFAVRVVVGYVRAAVAPGDAEPVEERGDGSLCIAAPRSAWIESSVGSKGAGCAATTSSIQACTISPSSAAATRWPGLKRLKMSSIVRRMNQRPRTGPRSFVES